MTTKVKPIPEGYHSITPYLIVQGASDAIEFYKRAFNAIEIFRMADPNGKVMHAEIKFGNSMIMLADEHPEMNAYSPKKYNGSPISIHLYVEDVDTIFNQAVAAGATIKRPLENQFYGDRTGGVDDPFGYHWYLATHIEDLSPEEISRRAEACKK